MSEDEEIAQLDRQLDELRSSASWNPAELAQHQMLLRLRDFHVERKQYAQRRGVAMQYGFWPEFV